MAVPSPARRVPPAIVAAWWLACAAVTAGLVATLPREIAAPAELWGALEQRPFEGRVASMPWRRVRPPRRNDGVSPVPWQVLAAAARAQDEVASSPTASALQRLGAAALAAGQLDAAVQALEDAAVADADGAAILADLAAAYLARGGTPGHAFDLARAFEAAERARRLNPHAPAALFNRALALEHLHLDTQAAQAWDAVIALEPVGSPWADEARQHLASIGHGVDGRDIMASDVGAMRDWAAAAAITPDVALPVVSSADGLFPALRDLAAERTGERRRDLAAAVQALLAADAALATPDYGAADRLAESVARQAWPDAAPVRLWAERIRLTVGFNTGRGVDVRARAERLAVDAAGLGFRALEADARHRLAGLDFVAGAYDQAVDGFESAMALRRAVGNRGGEVSSRLALGDSLRMLGRDPEAWEQYVANLAVGRLDDAVLDHARLVNPTNASLTAAMPATALAFSREAVRHAEGLGHPGLLTTALYLQARALVRLGAAAEARDTMSRCREVFGRLADAGIRDRYLADITQAEAEVLLASAPADAIRLARESQARFVDVRTRHRLLALAVTEAKAHRVLGDIDGARAALMRGVAIVEAQAGQIARADFLPSFVDASWDVFAELVDLEATAGRPEAALDWLDRGYDVRRRWRRDTPWSLAAVSQAGPVVAYLARPDALWMWMVRDGRVTQRRLAVPRDVLAREVARLAHVLTLTAAPAALDAAVAAIARDVWWPIAPAAAASDEVASRIALVLDPVLQRVPFALLPWEAGRPERLVDRTAVVLCPSISACAGAATAGPTGRVAALHAGQGGEGLAPLPEARAEAERIGRRYAGATVDIASERAIARALAGDDLVHFSGHAVADERYPGRSQLLLASDAGAGVRVPLGRVLAGPVRTRLVVLSACRTSRAEARRGDGGAGVAGEFLRAGVTQVIATQWDVRDDLAAEAMDAVHEALAAGAPSWTAVRAAQQRLRASGVPPQDWAGYVAYTSPAR